MDRRDGAGLWSETGGRVRGCWALIGLCCNTCRVGRIFHRSCRWWAVLKQHSSQSEGRWSGCFCTGKCLCVNVNIAAGPSGELSFSWYKEHYFQIFLCLYQIIHFLCKCFCFHLWAQKHRLCVGFSEPFHRHAIWQWTHTTCGIIIVKWHSLSIVPPLTFFSLKLRCVFHRRCV